MTCVETTKLKIASAQPEIADELCCIAGKATDRALRASEEMVGAIAANMRAIDSIALKLAGSGDFGSQKRLSELKDRLLEYATLLDRSLDAMRGANKALEDLS